MTEVIYVTENGTTREATPEEAVEILAAQQAAFPPEPALVPSEISRRQFFQELANRELITKEEALAAIISGTLPAEFESLVSAILDEDIKWQARMVLCGATTFMRTNWFVDYFAAMKGFSPAYMDDLWRKAFLIT